MAARFKLAGNEAIRREIKRIARLYPQGLATALYKVGVAILGDALPRTPVEFGVLRSSGYVSPPQGEGVKASVEVGFGTVYAVPQHERMDYRHPRGGGPKYLERAVEAVAPRALALMPKWVTSGEKWGQAGGVPTRPVINNDAPKRRSQRNRLARAGRNVRRRTGR